MTRITEKCELKSSATCPPLHHPLDLPTQIVPCVVAGFLHIRNKKRLQDLTKLVDTVL